MNGPLKVPSYLYAKGLEVLDAKELGLSTIDASVVDYFNQFPRLITYIQSTTTPLQKSEHPLVTRRYMWKVEY